MLKRISQHWLIVLEFKIKGFLFNRTHLGVKELTNGDMHKLNVALNDSNHGVNKNGRLFKPFPLAQFFD